jgi:hypothetical protein
VTEAFQFGVRLRDLARDVESEPQPPDELCRRQSPLERLEYPSLIIGGDLNALVDDVDTRQGVVALDAHRDRLPLSVLRGVDNEVGDDLLDS